MSRIDLPANHAAPALPAKDPQARLDGVPPAGTALPGLRAEVQRLLLASALLGSLGVLLVWWVLALHASASRHAGEALPIWWPTLLLLAGLGAIAALASRVWRRAGAMVLPIERLCRFPTVATEASAEPISEPAFESIESSVLSRQLSRAADHARACAQDVANAHNLWNLALVGQTARLRNREEIAAAEARGRRQTLNSLALHVRQPLRSIDDMMRLLLGSLRTPHQVEQAIIARTSARLLLDTLDSHVDRLGRPGEASRPGGRVLAFDIAEAVEDCVMLFARPAQQMGVELVCRVDSGLPCRVVADPVAIHQAVCALIVQALSMTGQGSLMVRMRASAGRHGEKRSLSVSVRDSGWTVEPTEAYGRPAVERAPDASVNIARDLARAAGGSLKVGSFSPDGVALRLELPLGLARSESLSSYTEAAPLPAPFRDPFRVLVAEQNAAARIVLRHYLIELNMDVTLVADGAQAWSAIAAAGRDDAPFDLVIAEHDLPVLDGPGLARRLMQQRRPGVSTRLCLLAPLDGEPAASGEAGVSVWMPTPLRRASLRTTLSELLRGVAPNAARPGARPASGLRAAAVDPQAQLTDPFVDSDWALGPAHLD